MSTIPQVTLTEKLCRTCLMMLPIDAFCRDKSRKDGRACYCRSCIKAYQNTVLPHMHETERRRRTTKEGRQRRKKYMRQYWQDNPDKVLERQRKRRERYSREPALRAKALAHKQKRRVRKTTNGGSYTTQEWRDLCARYEGRCLCCGVVTRLTPDHIIPLAKGGSGDIDNIQPLCLPCNLRKQTKTIDYRP